MRLTDLSFKSFHSIALFVLILLGTDFVVSCQESIVDKAEREAKEYTRKYCPTPEINNSRTDSIVFDRQTLTYTYYISFVNQLDDEELIADHRMEIEQMLIGNVRESTNMKMYLESGFRFKYVCRSGSNPEKVLITASSK